MFSCNVDHDGDRYGFVRHMKSSQDSFNFKHSKLNHILASRRLDYVAGQRAGRGKSPRRMGAR
jgi:hypothetical protein